MKKIYFAGTLALGLLLEMAANPLYGQNAGIGTSTPNASAVLDINSGNGGLLLPRMQTAAIPLIKNPAKGLMAYDSVKNQMMVNAGSAAAPAWQNVADGVWSLTGNSGSPSAFIGTTDDRPLLFKLKNQWSGIIDSASQSTYFGYLSGKDSAATPANTAFGVSALGTDLSGTGYNTALGHEALILNHTGYYNTAIGSSSLYNNTSGSENTAVGFLTLALNTSGFFNTAIGSRALNYNGVNYSAPQSTSYNTANGAFALENNVIGLYNTAEGCRSSFTCQAGNGNTACGLDALYTSYGNYNSSFGVESMYMNYLGDYNSAFGYGALNSENKTYDYRDVNSQTTAVGYHSLYQTHDASGNTALGYAAGAFTLNGYYNCFIGAGADVTVANQYNVIAVGQGASVPGASTVRFGNAAITSIGGPVDWSTISDRRVKRNIRENIPGLAFIRKLRPVTYHLNVSAIHALQQTSSAGEEKSLSTTIPQEMAAAYIEKEKVVYTGFVAQEVAQAARSLNYDFSGVDAPAGNQGLYGLRYEAFVVPLVKSVQELAAEGNQLRSASASLEQAFEKITQRLDALEKKNK